MTHLENFLSRIATFSQCQVYLNVTQAKRVISLLLLNNLYPVMSYRRVFKRKRIEKGHSLWSAISCPGATGWDKKNIDNVAGSVSIIYWIERDHIPGLWYYREEQATSSRDGKRITRVGSSWEQRPRAVHLPGRICWERGLKGHSRYLPPLCLPRLRFSYTLFTTKLVERRRSANERGERSWKGVGWANDEGWLLDRLHCLVPTLLPSSTLGWLLAFFIVEIQ